MFSSNNPTGTRAFLSYSNLMRSIKETFRECDLYTDAIYIIQMAFIFKYNTRMVLSLELYDIKKPIIKTSANVFSQLGFRVE